VENALRAFFCPCCGARLEPPALRLIQCSYCDARLQADPQSIVEQPSGPDQLPCSLSQDRCGRFELSHLYQAVGGHRSDEIQFFPLRCNDCALVLLRRCDSQGRNLPGRLPWLEIAHSLAEYGDVGLAAYQALQALCEDPQGFPDRLECAIAHFDHQRALVTVYAAGCRDSIYWLSNEQGSLTDLAGYREALERKMLVEQRDYFSPSATCEMAALDAVVLVSAGYAGRGGGPYASGTAALLEQLRASIGEDPLRLVTLAKNAFWKNRPPAAYEHPPAGALHVVAVQARPSPASKPWVQPPIQTLVSPSFETSTWAGPDDYLALLPLHGQRSVLVWASNAGLPFTPEQTDVLRRTILEVLDRLEHGDNENPRVAGRLAQERVPLTSVAIFLLLDRYHRIKYYRFGVPHPIYLAPRPGQNGSAIMAYDEGGELTLERGARLLLLCSPRDGEPLSRDDLARVWPGGKASNLYACLTRLWTTPPTEPALQQVLEAARGDEAELSPGNFLITAKAQSR